jgi:hypothetical protein
VRLRAACFPDLQGCWSKPFVASWLALLANDLRDHGATDAVSLRNLSEAQSAITIS